MFLGSSGEGAFAARILADLLAPQIASIHWQRGANVSETIIEYLERMTREVKMAAILVTPEDRLESRAKEYDVPRDNVIFELGFFMGALGRDNTFVILQEEDDLKLPSDLDGVIRFTYKKPKANNYRQVLERAALQVIECINSRVEEAESRAVYLPPLTASFRGGAHLSNSLGTALVLNGSGRCECFALNANGGVSHCYENMARGTWSTWAAYQGIGNAVDLSVLLFDQRLLVAILCKNGELVLYRQVNRYGTWGPPDVVADALGVRARLIPTSPARIVSIRDGLVSIATVGLDKKIAFSPIPGLQGKGEFIWMDAVTGIDDTIHIVAIDKSGSVWHARQLPAVAREEWSPWLPVAQAASPKSPHVAISGVGRLYTVFLDLNGRLCLRALRNPEGTNWADVEGFDAENIDPAPGAASIAMRQFDGGLRLYAASREGKLKVFSIDDATLEGAHATVDDINLQGVLCTNSGLPDDPILIATGDSVEARRN